MYAYYKVSISKDKTLIIKNENNEVVKEGKITKDIINFDYTVGMDKNNNIYVKSTNPYVKYNEISGFRISQPKKTHWSIGPSINIGYDPINLKPSFSIGASINYSLYKF